MSSLEKINVDIFEDAKAGSQAVAKLIASAIREKQLTGKPFVLGLATGSSPKYLYAELVRMHRQENLSFSNVISFNLDEYYPISKTAVQSYHHFMQVHLFISGVGNNGPGPMRYCCFFSCFMFFAALCQCLPLFLYCCLNCIPMP